MIAKSVASFSLGMLTATVLMWATVERNPRFIVVEIPVPGLSTESVSSPEWTRLCETNASESLDTLIEEVSLETGVDAALLAAVMTKESTCNPNAVGTSGEIGLNQINPRVWVPTLVDEGFIQAPSDLFDPATNLRCSAYILADLLDRTDGDVWGALRKYNGSGPRARRYADSVHGLYTTLVP